MSTQHWTTNNIPDLSGKVIIVTGGNSGLGYESVKAFAEKGAEVILASRSMERGETAKSDILTAVPDANIVVMQLDLQDLGSIRTFAKDFLAKYHSLDVLLNNAGIMMTPYGKTKDGFEAQFGTNHLGHFALTGLLNKTLSKTPRSRVVNVSSGAHKRGDMDFSNLMFEGGEEYTPMRAYGRSKLSNLLFTYEMQRRLETNGIQTQALAAHPGVSRTNLARHMEGKWWFSILWFIFKFFTQDQAQGALPQIRASVDPAAKGGEYYGPDGRREMTGHPVVVPSNEASHNLADARKLWEVSEDLTKVAFLS